MLNRETSADVVPLGTAVRAWITVALQSFGGPAGQIAVMHREFVDERRWVGEERFLHALSYCTLIPGPEAQQLAIYLGWLLNGALGGLLAGTLFVIPGYVAIMALSLIYAGFGDTTLVTAVFAGVAPAVLAIVTQAVVRLARRTLKRPFLLGIAITAFAALALFGVPFPLVIAGAGAAGYLRGRTRPPGDEPANAAHSPAAGDPMPPLIADDALHGERPSWRRAIRIVAIGLTVWAVPVLALGLAFGRSSVFVQQGTFFSGTALVTFGGAYSVLSFVAQRAVESYHWLTAREMVKGLAMAETTPGPLIQVVQFVAFLGAYRNAGSLNPWVAAIVAATLVTWVTYVPCFLFIFLGAPHIESLRGNRHLTATLSAITAAVVGVIANLAVFFASHTLFGVVRATTVGPLRIGIPRWSTASPAALFTALLAFALVFRFRWSVPRVLAVCAVVGGAIHLIAH